MIPLILMIVGFAVLGYLSDKWELRKAAKKGSPNVGCHLNRECLRPRSLCPSDATTCSPSFELPKIMEYTGKLYGKIGRRLIPLTMTSEEVDALRESAIKNAEMTGDLASDLQRLRSAVRNLRDVQGRHHTQIATERLLSLLPMNA